MNRRRAFTMLELLAATAIALVVVSAATSAIIVIVRALNRSGQSSAADAEAQIVSEYLVSQLQAIGGGAVRPWMVVAIKNNEGLDGSDLLTFADIPVSLPPSQTITRNPTPGTYSLFVQQGIRSGRPFGDCALARMRKDVDGDGFPEALSNAAAAYTVADLKGLQAILTSPTGDTWRSVVITDVGFGAAFDTCFVQFASTATGLTRNGALTDADRFTGLVGTEDPNEWVFGQVSFIRAREWKFVPAAGEVAGRLIENMSVANPAGVGTFGADRVLLEGVRDLQVSPGFDHNPFDGVIFETANGNDDEWLNSVPGDDSGRFRRLPEDLAGPTPPIAPDTLRMLDVAVVVQLPRAERSQQPARAFDGALKRGPEARVAGGRAYLRNLLLFL